MLYINEVSLLNVSGLGVAFVFELTYIAFGNVTKDEQGEWKGGDRTSNALRPISK
jgi:hypothetical protein